MATDKPRTAGEALEHQDASIKVRKSQLFDSAESPTTGGSLKPFAAYLRDEPAAPMAPAVKAALLTLAVVVGLLFVAALVFGRGGRGPKPRRAATAAAAPQNSTALGFSANHG